MQKTHWAHIALLCTGVSLSNQACKSRSYGDVKLVGGTRTGAENYPALTRIKINNKTHCTAGKIDETLFITAAHCVTQAGFRQGIYYGQRVSDAFSPGASIVLENVTGTATPVTVVATYPHPSFHWTFRNIDNWGADVAMFSVKEKTPQIAKSEIEFSKLPANKQITIAGFGCQEGSLAQQDIEYDIRIDENQRVLSRAELLKQGAKALDGTFFSSLSNDARAWGDEAFLATGSSLLSQTGSSALCPGDSGGPAFVKTPTGAKIVGVNSGMGLNDNIPNSNGIPVYSLHTRLHTGGMYEVGEWIKTIQNLGAPKTNVIAQAQVNVSPEAPTAAVEIAVPPQPGKTWQIKFVPLFRNSTPGTLEEVIFRGSTITEMRFERKENAWQASTPITERGLLQLKFSTTAQTGFLVLVTSIP